MLGQNPNTAYQINHYYHEKVQLRRQHVQKTIQRLAKVVQDVLKDVEGQEPRFISTLVEAHGKYDGLIVHSPYEYEVILYLNQMGVFNFVDDGSIQGCAVLKLSDGRKRSMSLWVEFITASGYLSARKIRSRFQSLVGSTVEKDPFRSYCKLVTDTSDVKIRVDDKFTVQITCAFRCNGIWPRSANCWPAAQAAWPAPALAAQCKADGFDLTSRETSGALAQTNKQASSMEGDAWAMCLAGAESHLLGGQRRKAYSILKCLRDHHLDFPGTPVTNYIVKTLVLFECEKHPADYEWEDVCIADRIIGVLLQLVSCLQCRRCTHYILPQLDLLRCKPPHLLDQSAKAAWQLLRQLMLNARALESL